MHNFLSRLTHDAMRETWSRKDSEKLLPEKWCWVQQVAKGYFIYLWPEDKKQAKNMLGSIINDS